MSGVRYVSNERIKEGMTVGRPLYGANFNILLGEGMRLSAQSIKRVVELGYPGIYIEDELSADVRENEIISPMLRVRTVQAAKDINRRIETGEFKRQKFTREYQNKIIRPVIDSIIDSPKRITDLIDLKPFSDYDFYHAANVMVLSLLIGIEMGLQGSTLHELGMSSLLHDVGNIFIPKSILNKPGKLTPEEFDVIKTHSQIGFEYLREHFDMTIEACLGAFQHHENFDGTGYPNMLSGKKITIYGRIIAVTTVYDSLTSHRPFRAAVFPPAAMDFMDDYDGKMFDPEIVAALKRVAPLYPAGCCVELESGERGIVVENYTADPARPKIKLLDIAGIDGQPVYINLHSDRAYASEQISEIIEV